MCRGVQSVAGVVTWMIELGLAHLEDVHLDRALGRRQEHRCRLDGPSTVGAAEDFQPRDVIEQPVDDFSGAPEITLSGLVGPTPPVRRRSVAMTA